MSNRQNEQKMAIKWFSLKTKTTKHTKGNDNFSDIRICQGKKKKNGTTLTDGRSMQESSTHARDCKKETGQQKQCS